jgi:hypothetical protein
VGNKTITGKSFYSQFERRGGMRKGIIVGLAIIAGAAFCILNAQAWQWAKQWGTKSGEDAVQSATVDAQGNIYIAGSYQGRVPFVGTTALDSSGNLDYFVAKCNSSGVAQWAKRAGTPYNTDFKGDDVGFSIALDAQSNVICAGMVSPAATGTVDFGNSQTLGSSWGGWGDAFLVKYDNTGTTVWAKKIVCGAITDKALAVATDANSNIYVGGSYEVSRTNPTLPNVFYSAPGVSFNPRIWGKGQCAFFGKLTSAGAGKWIRMIHGGSGAQVNDIAVQGGSVYVTGYYSRKLMVDSMRTGGTICDSVNYATATGTADQPEIFVIKLDTLGKVAWAKSFGNADIDIGYGICVNTDSMIYVTGTFNKSSKFGTTTLTSKYNTTFLAKLKGSDGSVVWAKQISDSASAGGLAADVALANANVIIAGTLAGADNTPGGIFFAGKKQSCVGMTDAFVAAWDTTGTEKWALSAGGYRIDEGNCIAAKGSLIYTGGSYMSESTTFGSLPALTLTVTAGITNSNAFLACIDQAATILIDMRGNKSAGSQIYTIGSGMLKVVVSNLADANAGVRLLNSAGQVVAAQSLAKGVATLSTDKVSAGMYVVQVVNGKDILCSRSCFLKTAGN